MDAEDGLCLVHPVWHQPIACRMQAFSKGKSAVYLPYAGHPETQRPRHLEAVVVCANVAGLGRTPCPDLLNASSPPSATLNALIPCCCMTLPDSWLQLPFSPVPPASIHVAGDTPLLQVFEHRGHWQRKLLFGWDAQPTPANSFRAPCFAVRFAGTRSWRAMAAGQRGDHRHSRQPASRHLMLRVPGGFRGRLTFRAKNTKRPTSVHQIRPCLPWCSTLPALRRKLCRGFCLQIPRHQEHQSTNPQESSLKR